MPSTCLNGRQEESTITNCGKEKNDSHKDELKLKFVVRFRQALLEKQTKTPTVSFKQQLKTSVLAFQVTHPISIFFLT